MLLGGLGTPAPALDFAPLIRELGDFNVIVVEGFGYGYSDLNASERTNQNISTELHEVLTNLNIARPYVLAGHSIAGFYLLDYANRYPAELSAVVAIDPSLPKATADPGELPLQGPTGCGCSRSRVWPARWRPWPRDSRSPTGTRIRPTNANACA